jgi:hypothetical protein
MPKRNHNLKFSEIELFIYRAASLIFLLLMLIKLFVVEVSSW